MDQQDKQKVFDIVAKHLLTQNAQSKSKTGYCKYRNENGLKCAIGVLIPDEVYSPKYEGTNITSLLEVHHGARISRYLKKTFNVISYDDYNFCRNLQWVHDDSTPQYWRQYLETFADLHNLNKDVLQ